ncbi:hypothetical protein B0T22DRAFT_474069 [Podospora appendiculata]|uniref:Uncharacterized protein n=1 Tax=Podospora appendiculata TaxID=314037 RepID=A0AAE0WZA0_9PEZI|nr:hypothetical protein B0T22DRAFT_474069 [Podospora appendiculata]
MDLLWRGSNFTDEQSKYFRYNQDLPAQNLPVANGHGPNQPRTRPETTVTAAHFAPTARDEAYTATQHSVKIDSIAQWDDWLDNKVPLSDAEGSPSTTILFFPRFRSQVEPSLRDIGILKRLPIPRPVFEKVVAKLHIHQAFQLIIIRGQPIICRLELSGDCTTYLLRSNSALKRDLALSLTYFKNKQRTYAAFFGCEQQDVDWVQTRLAFTGKTVLAPLTLISAFLELEKMQRFDEVGEYDQEIVEMVENFSDETYKSQAYAWVNEDDPKDLVRISRKVTYMKNDMEKWRSEIAGLKSNAADFPKELEIRGADSPAGSFPAAKIPLLDADNYLGRLVSEYEDKIRKCDAMLATVSLAFQMETAGNARKEADKMKTVALLTMFFLPATFVSTLLAMGIFQWRPSSPSDSTTSAAVDDSVVAPWFWKLYIPLVVALTLVVLGLYYLWTPIKRCLRRVNNEKSDELRRNEDIEMAGRRHTT